MKILFDLVGSQPMLGFEFHGGGKYTKKVFFSVIDRPEINSDNFFCFYDSSLRIDNDLQDKLAEKKIELIDIKNNLIEEIVDKYKITKIYSSLPDKILYPVIQKKTCEVIGTIHGLRFLETKQTLNSLKYEKGKAKLLSFAKIILANILDKRYYNHYENILKANVVVVSNHTKYALYAYYKQTKNISVKVFYSPDVTDLGAQTSFTKDSSFEHTNYFLLTSGKRWVKNNLRSVWALDELFSDYPEFKHSVVVTGVKDTDVFKAKLKNPDRFTFLNYVDEAYLNKLYANAFAFVYMSLNEGFGYPPLEAMKAGLPVITSPFTSISEVCEDAVLYANPYSVKEIKNRMLWLIMDEQKRTELIEKGHQQFAKINAKQVDDLKLLTEYILS